MQKLTADRLDTLTYEVGQWAEKNFDIHSPAIGILEEIGEAAHCILKRKQGIRGFDNPEHFKAKLEDALADIAIYGFHANFLCQGKSWTISDIKVSPGDDDLVKSELLLSRLAEYSSRILCGDEIQESVASILDHCNALALVYGIDFTNAVETTWAKVSQRDWRKNKTDADTKVESAVDTTGGT